MRPATLLTVGLAWGLGLLFTGPAVAQPSNSPSSILEKGQWAFGLGGGGLWKRAMKKGGAELSVYEGSHTRGYGLTNRTTLYGEIGGAYVGNEDPSVAENVDSDFGRNLILGGQLNSKLWTSATGRWEWYGSLGYRYLGAPHKSSGNKITWKEWQLATSLAWAWRGKKPYAGLKLSALNADYQIRSGTTEITGTYRPKDVIGPFAGIDWVVSEDQETIINLEGSYIGGPSVNVTWTTRF